MKSNKSPTHTVSVKVTACDRNGHMLGEQLIHREFEHQCISDRKVVFSQLKTEFPDCQIYFNWNGKCKEPLTETLR